MVEIVYLYYVLKEIHTMRTMNQKAIDYLDGNPIVKKFIDEVNKKRSEHYSNIGLSKESDLVIEIGNKFIRLWQGTSCWGFISRVDGDLKGSPIKKGDLLKAASWKAPAKHARGNIMDGSARYSVYGPEYL